MIHLGFTGTRFDPTDAQKASLRIALAPFKGKDAWGHHGLCVGADGVFHELCRELGIKVHGHPPVETSHKYECECDILEEPKTHFARNRDIVNASQVLIGVPKDPTEQPYGGTWYTIRYARKLHKPNFVFWPDGTVDALDAK